MILRALFLSLTLVSASLAEAQRYDGNELIDNHRYDDAIRLFSNRIAQNSDDTESRVLLASTYAARNGISLAKFMGVARVIANAPAANKSAGISGMLAQLNMVFSSLAALPDLNGPEGLRDLQTAIRVMPDKPNASYGYYLYRALLRLVILKDDLRFRHKLKPLHGECTVSDASLQRWLEGLGAKFSLILEDVAKGTKDSKKASNVLGTKAKLREVISPEGADVPSETEMNDMPEALKGLYPC